MRHTSCVHPTNSTCALRTRPRSIIVCATAHGGDGFVQRETIDQGGYMHRSRLFALTFVTAAGLAPQAQAGGFYLQEQSVRGTGRAYSGEVADTGVASLWWNPSAIARSGREAYVGLHSVFVDGQVADRGSTITYPGGATVPVGGHPLALQPILPGLLPNFAIAPPGGDPLAPGVL